MAYCGVFEIYKCDGKDCRRKTEVPSGYDINLWPPGTNQRWCHETYMNFTLCPKCKKKQR